SELLFDRPPRSQSRGEGWTADSDHEVLKSATWGSSERGWDQWISRDLYLSVRLLHLLKSIKAKGFYEATCQTPVTPDKDESAWNKGKLQLLFESGVPLNPAGTVSDDDAKWLRQFLKTQAGQVEREWDIKAAEKRVSAKLPKSYVDFVTAV